MICEKVTDIPWLSVGTTLGVIPPSGNEAVQVQVDSTGLAGGTDSAQVCVNSDASNARIIAVPVEM